jgi:hypothetical protein
MSILSRIDAIETDIFKYEVSRTADELVSIFSDVLDTGAVSASDTVALVKFNSFMGECLGAMQSKDYLLLADLLEYRLKPMMGGIK